MWRETSVKLQGVFFCRTCSVCPHIELGGLEGFRGLFPLRISFVLVFCYILPWSYQPTSKVLVETVLTGFYSWACFIQSAVSTYYTKHTYTQISYSCSNLWNLREVFMWQQELSLACIVLHVWNLRTHAASMCYDTVMLSRFTIFTLLVQCFSMLTFSN